MNTCHKIFSKLKISKNEDFEIGISILPQILPYKFQFEILGVVRLFPETIAADLVISWLH